jgi:hypothetical protein
MNTDPPTVRTIRLLPAEDLPGSVRQSLSDLAKISESLDAGTVPSLAMAATLETISREIRGAAAICGGYNSGITA